MSFAHPNILLRGTDPDPVEVIHPFSTHPVLLICEHAGRAVPQSLNGLGLSEEERCRHIAWDIGAAEVTRRLAHSIGATAILQRYSRLVIDCNRPPEAPDSAAPFADGLRVTGNENVPLAERRARQDEIFHPFHDAVTRALNLNKHRLVLSLHSFTPVLAGRPRPWEISFLFRDDTETSTRLERITRAQGPDLTIGMNEPYQVEDASDWFIPKHGEARKLPHSLIEIRNDLITDAPGQQLWADRMGAMIATYLQEMQNDADT